MDNNHLVLLDDTLNFILLTQLLRLEISWIPMQNRLVCQTK